MGLREKVEKNPIWYMLGIVFIGWLAGLGTVKGIMEFANLDLVQEGTYTKTVLIQQKPEEESYVPRKITYVVELNAQGQTVRSYIAGVQTGPEGELQEVRVPGKGNKNLLVSKELYERIEAHSRDKGQDARFSLNTGEPLK